MALPTHLHTDAVIQTRNAILFAAHEYVRASAHKTHHNVVHAKTNDDSAMFRHTSYGDDHLIGVVNYQAKNPLA